MTTYRRAEAAPAVDRPTLNISWARLPVLWWRDVPVVTFEPVELNELDTFTLAAVERLGHLHEQAFEEFTGLPPLVFNGLARRLHSLALLDWRDGVLRPQPGLGQPDGSNPPGRNATTTLDFLYLPETDDLVVVEDGLGEWEREGPQVAGAAPLPVSLHALTVRTLLSNRIAQRRVANLPANVIALADGEDEALTAMAGADPKPPVPVCPVIECAATVSLDEPRPNVSLEVAGASKRRRGHDDEPLTIDISGTTGLVSRWSHEVTRLADDSAAATKAMQALGLTEPPWPPLRSDHPGSWWLTVNGQQAKALADHGLLTAPVGLEIGRTHARIVTAVRLTAADRDAQAMIDLDAVVQDVLQNLGAHGRPVGRHDQRVRDVGGVGPLLTRAWQLQFYSLVHALREAEDFDYA